MHYSLISGLFIANLIFKHPHFCTKKVDCVFEKIVANWTIVRLRLFSVVAVWVVPTMICLVVSMFSPFYILKNSHVFRGEVFGRGVKNAMASQIFIPKQNYELSEVQLLLAEAADRPIEIDRNTKSNRARIGVSMYRESDGKNLFNKTLEVPVKDMALVTCYIGKVIVEAGTRYKLCFTSSDENGDSTAYFAQTYRGFDEFNHAIIDGHMQPWSYCCNLLGRLI